MAPEPSSSTKAEALALTTPSSSRSVTCPPRCRGAEVPSRLDRRSVSRRGVLLDTSFCFDTFHLSLTLSHTCLTSCRDAAGSKSSQTLFRTAGSRTLRKQGVTSDRFNTPTPQNLTCQPRRRPRKARGVDLRRRQHQLAALADRLHTESDAHG